MKKKAINVYEGTYRAGKKKVDIITDSYTEKPDGYLTKMYCKHSKYNLGDEQLDGDDKESYLLQILQDAGKLTGKQEKTLEIIEEELARAEYTGNKTQYERVSEKIENLFDEVFYWRNLYLYDHSGITMNTTGFSCGWDSGQVGFIVLEKKVALAEWSRKRATRKFNEKMDNRLVSTVKTYDQYLTGEVFGVVIYDENNKEEDACGGFYGTDIRESGILDFIKDFLTKKELKDFLELEEVELDE